MSKESFNRLMEAARLVEESASKEEKLHTLTHAFDLFTQETKALEKSYNQLNHLFESTTNQLTDRSDQLDKKVAQIDVITRYLHNILNSISHGILFVDLNGIVTTYNGAAEAILERDSLDVLFASFWDHFSDDLLGFSMGEALSERQAPETLFVTIENPSGQIRELELQTSFVLQSGAEPSITDAQEDYIEVIQGIVVVMRDRTEINQLRRIANRNDRMKELGEIAASVAHEIRNPLGGIKGFASLLHRDLVDKPHLQQMADHIIEGADSLNRLVSNVLNYARPLQLNIEPTDLLTLAYDLKYYIAAEYGHQAHVAIEVNSNLDTLKIPIDRQLFHGALMNLLVNSIQAMPKGGIIEIGIQEKVGKAIITVKDSGYGIPEDHLEKIFSPFFTTKASGNGFGLSEVHKVVLAHEGTIEVQSEEAVGTTFTIKLPSKTFARKKL